MVAWEDVQLFNKSSGGVIGQAEPSVERCKGAEYQQVVMFECRVWAFRGSVGGIRAFGRSLPSLASGFRLPFARLANSNSGSGHSSKNAGIINTNGAGDKIPAQIERRDP